jgi:hypothetical protein
VILVRSWHTCGVVLVAAFCRMAGSGASEPSGNSFHSCPTLIDGALAPVIAGSALSRQAFDLQRLIT